MHLATQAILKYFAYDHLPEQLAGVSRLFHDLAWKQAETLPEGPEVTVCLRKLLEAKDCAVRAMLG